MLRRAMPAEWEALERFRKSAWIDPDPVQPSDLAGPAQRGLVWLLEGASGVSGMFRVEGVSRRRVQVTEACIEPSVRGRGLGTELLRAAAHVARAEYARGLAMTLVPDEAAERTARRAGLLLGGTLDDVHLAA
jgi:ribosomal protein S18 acetylase RimI-like enzyme